jgi:hypothetical protein
MSFGGCWVFQKLKEKKQKPLFEALEKMKEGQLLILLAPFPQKLNSRAQKLRLLLHG